MKKILFVLVYFLTFNVFAENLKTYSNNLNRCKVTKNILNDYEPKIFEHTNNLLRKTGQLSKYNGEKILIKGRILDQNCIPVSDAKIYFWQLGLDGRYPYEPLRTNIDKKRFHINNNSSFTGSGTATSNNKGDFYFLSIQSYKSNHHIKNAYIRVEHPKLQTIQTRLDLTDKNICTYECGEVNSLLIPIEENVKTYCFDIVLKGTTLKRY